MTCLDGSYRSPTLSTLHWSAATRRWQFRVGINDRFRRTEDLVKERTWGLALDETQRSTFVNHSVPSESHRVAIDAMLRLPRAQARKGEHLSLQHVFLDSNIPSP